ncbi:MAG: bifunctional folylpolyglutamate synthase/dihydrofolate synthase [Bacteroidetes bacterium]|nr:bifunctional folylpolyglutamate synthase/dihydrofolate synthase [Bacteroidota bacterium]
MTYKETIDFLYSNLPMYSRIGRAAYKKDLTNTLKLCGLLDHPEKKFKSIHIAGTNGKGSTSHMLAAILQHAGYRTGLYTSPHLKDFRERIRINGQMIPQAEVVDFVEQHKEKVMKIGCSFFEWTVGLAFHYFAKNKVDIAVIETGLGGRLDSTNVITPLLSVITNISWDHAEMLGDSLKKIAAEKAGIIKPGVPVIIGERNKETDAVFISKARELKSPIRFASSKYRWRETFLVGDHAESVFELRNKKRLMIKHDLRGVYQGANVATVFMVCEALEKAGFRLPKEKILDALLHVRKLTGLRGRWDIMRTKPTVIADVAHNESGIQITLDGLKKFFPHATAFRFVLGFVKEKDLAKILPLFPAKATYYFCKPDLPRGLDAPLLLEQAKTRGLTGTAFPSVRSAYLAALKDAGEEDVIYVGGSTFVIAEVL